MSVAVEERVTPQVRQGRLALRPRWRKVLRDLWTNRQRTGLMALSIAIGVFAVGVIATTDTIVTRDLSASYAATDPASATIYTVGPFDGSLIESVRAVSGVKAAEGRRSLTVRVKVG